MNYAYIIDLINASFSRVVSLQGNLKWTKDDLVQHATSFATSLGLFQLPALPKRTLGKSSC